MVDVNISKLKRFFSFFFPIKIWSGSSSFNPYLELHLVSGHFRLSTIDAIYSDGTFYRPLTLAFKNLEQKLMKSKSMLVLGAGIGSAIEIADKYTQLEQVTLVDIDDIIIEINKLIHGQTNKVSFVCQDAALFVQQCNQKYDIIIIDVFQNQQVPDFVLSTDFLENCKKLGNEGACIVLNYIISQKENWEKLNRNFNLVFPNNKVLQLELNRILVAIV